MKKKSEESYVPADKDPVCLTYDKDQHGIVVRAGPEVSTVRFDRGERHIPNYNLRKVK